MWAKIHILLVGRSEGVGVVGNCGGPAPAGGLLKPAPLTFTFTHGCAPPARDAGPLARESVEGPGRPCGFALQEGAACRQHTRTRPSLRCAVCGSVSVV